VNVTVVDVLLMLVAATPPTVTPVAPVKPVPVPMTTVPPTSVPLDTSRDTSEGGDAPAALDGRSLFRRIKPVPAWRREIACRARASNPASARALTRSYAACESIGAQPLSP